MQSSVPVSTGKYVDIGSLVGKVAPGFLFLKKKKKKKRKKVVYKVITVENLFHRLYLARNREKYK